MTIWLLLIFFLFSQQAMAMSEHIQSYVCPESALNSTGDLSDLPAAVRPFFRPNGFDLKKSPGPHDWLAQHPEPGQPYQEYIDSRPPRPGKNRKTIYVQPLGEIGPEEEEIVNSIGEFLQAYFQTETVVRPVLPLDSEKTVTRINPFSGTPQVLASSVMDNILLPRMPADAFCLLGITTVDLYPDPSWNFVFGQASLKFRTGIHSLARYDPLLSGENIGRESRRETILRRALKVAAHETGHMLGLGHCIYYECILNGSNHLAESDGRPLYLCPTCLRKLYWNLGFDPARRYQELASFFLKHGLSPEGEWYRKRLQLALPPKPPGQSERK